MAAANGSPLIELCEDPVAPGIMLELQLSRTAKSGHDFDSCGIAKMRRVWRCAVIGCLELARGDVALGAMGVCCVVDRKSQR